MAWIARIILRGGDVEERRFDSRSELAAFIKIACLDDVELIIVHEG